MNHARRASWMVNGLLLTLGFGLAGACSSAGTPDGQETYERALCVNNGAGLGFGSGADGAYAPAASGAFAETATSANGTAGSTTLTVGSDAGFAVNNLVLVHQTQGANAGVWEIEAVTATTATTLTFALPLQNTYASDATDAAQAVKVPQFTTVTIAAARIISAPPWNGTTGGLLPFVANGIVLLNGTLQATGAGYRGGVGDGGNNACPGTPKAGFQGESSVGAGARSTVANGEAGGGGGTTAAFCCSNCPATQGTTGDSGGGGGGYGVAGTAGMGSAPVGAGGGTAGPTNLTSVFFGGGGGAGGGNCTVSSPPGGAGGGAIVISATVMTVGAAGALEANGVTPGINGAMNWEGGGGGGAGGAITVSAATLVVPGNTMSATGAIGAEQCAGNGGNGGAGRVRVTCGTLNGATCAGASGAFSNPPAVVGAFCSFATCTTNSECAPATPVCNPTSHACVQCDANGDCTGNISGPLCDTTKHTCGTCTPADTAMCTGTTPVCNITGADDKCAACTGDFGTITAEPCTTAALPACVLTGATAGACVQCDANGDCTGNPSGPLCDTTKNTCGTCTAMDTATCTGTTPVCNVTGTNDTCAACTGNFGTTTAEACPTVSLPVCLLAGATAGACVQCQTFLDCGTAAAPVCDAATNTCVPCNGDNGSGATDACPSSANPYCTASGTCGKCANDASCTTGTHAGPFCDPTTGSCGTACFTDAECGAGNWCNETAHMCTPQVANGSPIPIDGAHVSPVLNGMCSSTGAALLTCVSGVCDTDNDCGYANGDGPCTMANGTVVCRSGACSNSGTCEASGGCNVDADCTAGNWCNETAHMCTPQLTNGTAVPTDTAHTNPTLNGVCTAAAGTLVCTSGVCDTKDNKCGYANGDGPCTAADGATDCRSTLCEATDAGSGLCVACLTSTQCSGGTPVCNTTSGTCVQCTASSSCPSTDPVCNTTSSTCVPCNGDFGSTATHDCGTMAEPFCFLTGANQGQCGKCSSNADCTGHTGNLCDTTSGLCTSECATDADCLSSQWCNAVAPARGMCEPKLANGVSLPMTPSTVATCSTTVGERICISTVCDPKNNQCGFALGEGPCTSTAECDTGTCNPKTMTCALPQGDAGTDTGKDAGKDAGSGCHADTDCKTGNYCAGNGACTPTQPTGQTCTLSAECQSNDCFGGVCSTVVSSGSGLFCAMREPGSSHGSGSGGVLGLLLALAGVGYRRRRTRST